MLNWVYFIILGLSWGSSFLFIEIALRELPPFTLTAYRLFFGVIFLLALLIWKKEKPFHDIQHFLKFIFMALFNTAIPFALITWGQKSITSGMASILNSTMPLFTILIAHFWLRPESDHGSGLHDEKITLPKMLGLIIGFIGVVLLITQNTETKLGGAQNLSMVLGQLAVLAAASCYALSATFARKHLQNYDHSPLGQAAALMIIADISMWLLTPLEHWPIQIPHLETTWLALIIVGTFGTALGYLCFFHLIKTWGPTKTSLVTYTFPVVGISLGILFLNEPFDSGMAWGTLLIVLGVFVVNYRKNTTRQSVSNNKIFS